MIFLPPNTTSKLQPLDVGIIQNFKVHYKTLLLRYVLSKIDHSTCTAAEIVKSVDVLKAIRWVAEAWNSVKQETMVKCFKKCGIISTESLVVSRTGVLEDPFSVIDESCELTMLLNKIDIGPTCSPKEYIAGDDSLPVCDDSGDHDDWDDRFLAELSQLQAQHAEETVQDDDDDELFDMEPPPLKLKTYQEAISALEDVQSFLDTKGHNALATNLGIQINSMIDLQVVSMSNARQTTIDEYF